MHTIRNATLVILMAAPLNASPLDFVHEIRIAAPEEKVWSAIVTPELVGKYHLAPLRKIELRKDGVIEYGTPEQVMISGKITAIEPGTSLSHTFRFAPANHSGTTEDSETVVTYTLRKDGDGTILKLVHSGFTEDNQTRANVTGGWPFILGEMKSFLEK